MTRSPTLRSGIAWSAVSLGGRQAIRMVAAFVLARLLGPQDFGIAGQAIVYLTLGIIFASFGFTSAIVQRPDLSDRYLRAATWVSLLTATGSAAVTYASAPFVASVFDTPELVAVIRVLTVLILIHGLAVIPTALLMRDLRFNALARAELSSAVAGAIAGIVAAVLGAGYWAPVAQMLVTNSVLTAALLAVERPRLGRTDTRAVREVLGFGATVLSTNCVNFGSNNGDNLLIGATLGATPLGLYDLSYRVLSIPLRVIGQTVNRTIMPAFSRAQDRPRRIADLYESVVRGVAALVTGPLIITAFAAGDAIPWAFGEQWSGAVTPTRWIAIAGIFRLIFGSDGTVMVSMGKPGWQFGWSAGTTIVSVIGFVVGIQWWGINGVAASVAVLGLPMGMIGVWVVGRLVPVSTIRVAMQLCPSMLAGLVSAGLWIIVAPLTDFASIPVRLTVRCLVASSGYSAALFISGQVRTDVRSILNRPTHNTSDTTDGM